MAARSAWVSTAGFRHGPGSVAGMVGLVLLIIPALTVVRVRRRCAALPGPAASVTLPRTPMTLSSLASSPAPARDCDRLRSGTR
jgi:hypothetical protein